MMIRMDWDQLQDDLRTRMKAQRGSQAEVARRLEVSRAAVAEYVSGNRNIPVGHINVILDVLQLQVDLIPKRAN
ncbi:hypothetical protein GCM10008959_10610 [Deinococcus seoulensis]|uniref:HTH cro/C1-type domain-containing protein n=1 Tax=Deinococcus seoulensis TaxID=1837379 RepID=A0ABQ2RN14_9DEIO|nr:helix-turn-helix transcriptional regulator [Deinococcus seoulensis]GGR51127.1 hypothetical protein GCM10008959_10610 [Deinococcus seoulensis]